MADKIRVTIWNEYRKEREEESVREIYPEGIHGTIANALAWDKELQITKVCLDDPEQGLPDELLNNTDVLVWWGYEHHDEVRDELVEKIKNRVLFYGMGFIALHSSHHSKVFQSLVGCSGDLTWGRLYNEVMWNMLPSHPIAKGIPQKFLLSQEELYAEPFHIPKPDEVVFAGWYECGYMFRSGCCYYRGLGKVFYFQPGHEYCPSFHNEYVQKIIDNAIHWAAPADVVIDKPYEGFWSDRVDKELGFAKD